LLIDGGGQPPNYGCANYNGSKYDGKETQRGPDPGDDAVSPYLWSRGFKKIDVVASHTLTRITSAGSKRFWRTFESVPCGIGRDVQTPALARLESARTLQAGVLKVGHHGSKDLTTQEFLAAV